MTIVCCITVSAETRTSVVELVPTIADAAVSASPVVVPELLAEGGGRSDALIHGNYPLARMVDEGADARFLDACIKRRQATLRGQATTIVSACRRTYPRSCRYPWRPMTPVTRSPPASRRYRWCVTATMIIRFQRVTAIKKF